MSHGFYNKAPFSKWIAVVNNPLIWPYMDEMQQLIYLYLVLHKTGTQNPWFNEHKATLDWKRFTVTKGSLTLIKETQCKTTIRTPAEENLLGCAFFKLHFHIGFT